MRAAWIAASSIMCVTACSGGGERGENGTPTVAPRPAPRDPADPAEPSAVVLTGPDGTELRVIVEVVRTQRDRNRGLMHREYLAPDRGMLFIFDREEIQSFWMKNTLIPLDMIFIRKDMSIAGVVENAAPQTLTSRKVEAPSIYVLEVNGGWSKENGIGPGATVRFENVEL